MLVEDLAELIGCEGGCCSFTVPADDGDGDGAEKEPFLIGEVETVEGGRGVDEEDGGVELLVGLEGFEAGNA